MTTTDQPDLTPPPDATAARSRWYDENRDGTSWSRPFLGTVRGRVQVHGVQHGDGRVERGVLIEERNGEVWLDNATEALEVARALVAASEEIQALSDPDGSVGA